MNAKPALACLCRSARDARRIWEAAELAGCAASVHAEAGALLEAACDVAVLVDAGADDLCSVARELRARRAGVFVLVAVPDSAQAAVLRAFESGADDVVAWPLAPRLLSARVRAMLRRRFPQRAPRPQPPAKPRLDARNLTLRVEGLEIALTASEAKLLAVLLRRAGRAVPRVDLLGALWNTRERVRTRSVDVHVANLRRKLSRSSCRILAARPVGYRFIAS